MKRAWSVGLTGGLACGKSAVASLLSERGAHTIDADAVVASLYRPGQQGARAVEELFGSQFLTADGGVDRHQLGGYVLDRPDDLQRLNAAIHPLVKEHIQSWLEAVDSSEIAVVEAALMIESGSYRLYDQILVVWCRPEQQIARAIARGMSATRAQALIEAQLELSEKRRFADIVIDNSHDLDHLAREVDAAWESIARARNECAKRVSRE